MLGLLIYVAFISTLSLALSVINYVVFVSKEENDNHHRHRS
jgi:hypothetical protein